MSQENLEVVQDLISAVNDRDLDRYLAHCTEDIKLETPWTAVEGVYVGPNAIRRFFSDLRATAPDFQLVIERLEPIGAARVLALLSVRASGRASGITADVLSASGGNTPTANIYDFAGGKIRRIRVFLDREEALEAAEPRESAMSRENVEVVRRAIEANRSDDVEAAIEALVALSDPQIEYTSVMAAVESNTYRGHDGIRRYVRDLADSWQEWRMQAEEVFGVKPDTVIAVFRTHSVGRDSGVAVESRRAAVFALSEGKIVRGRTYPNREEALEAVVLRE